MPFFSHPTSESPHPSSLERRDQPHESVGHSVFVESFSASSRTRDSVPDQYKTHFDGLVENIRAFAREFSVPIVFFDDPDALTNYLRDSKPSVPLEALERFYRDYQALEYLITHKEPMKEDLTEALEYTERLYHLSEQYTSQVVLLEQVGILHPRLEQQSQRMKRLVDFFRSLLPFGKKKRPEVKEIERPLCMTGIDNKEYQILTLEQIAKRLFERREELTTKHNQGFTKLLLVPFGMSLEILFATLKQFLLRYKELHPDFYLDSENPVHSWEGDYGETDFGDLSKLVYYPHFFDKEQHQGQTKFQILKEGQKNPVTGWRLLLLQSAAPEKANNLGVVSLRRKEEGKRQNTFFPRLDFDMEKTPREYLITLEEAQDDRSSPYHSESGMILEDWIIAFITHLQETREPLDGEEYTNVHSILIGAYLRYMNQTPTATWIPDRGRVVFSVISSFRNSPIACARSVVVI